MGSVFGRGAGQGGVGPSFHNRFPLVVSHYHNGIINPCPLASIFACPLQYCLAPFSIAQSPYINIVTAPFNGILSPYQYFKISLPPSIFSCLLHCCLIPLCQYYHARFNIVPPPYFNISLPPSILPSPLTSTLLHVLPPSNLSRLLISTFCSVSPAKKVQYQTPGPM